MNKRLSRAFFARHALDVAPELLNALFVRGARVGRIVEIEVYSGATDRASHAYRGKTARNATMFGDPGHLYVYFTYGMHYCANIVCGVPGEVSALLLRAIEPLEGLDEMRIARHGAKRDVDLCSGPGKLCQAYGIDRSFDGSDLLGKTAHVQVLSDGTAPPENPFIGPRIGLSVRSGDDGLLPWRFAVAGSRFLSRKTLRPA